MTAYNMEYFISDFAKRTKENLDVINELAKNKYKDGKRVFEVTQLINSFLGLVIFPNEKFKKLRSGKIAMNGEMIKTVKNVQKLLKDCKKEHKYFNNFEDASNSEDTSNPGYIFLFSKHLRNAVAHRGIHIFPVSEGKEITDIIFYDSDYYVQNKKGMRNHEFCLKLTVKQVADLAGYIADFYINIEKDDQNRDYIKWVKNLDILLQNDTPFKMKVLKEVTVAEQMESPSNETNRPN